MSSKFKDTFVRKPQFNTKTPESIISLLNEELPKQFHYVEASNGMCILKGDKGLNITIARNNIVLPDSAKILLKNADESSVNEILSYAYNSQTPLEIIPDEDGCLNVNDERISIDQLIRDPWGNIEFRSGHLFLSPPEFTPFFVQVEGNGYSMEIEMKRMTVHSLDEIKIESVSKSALRIFCTLDSTMEKMKFNINTAPTHSVQDVLASKNIYNAFLSGKGTLCGYTLESQCDNQVQLIPDEVLSFWNELSELEGMLPENFDAMEKLDFDDILLVHKLYRSLIQKKPFRTNLTSFSLSGEGEFNRTELVDTEKDYLFEYTEGVEAKLLGVDLQLYSLTDIIGGVPYDVKLPDKNASGDFSIVFTPKDEGKMYASTQYFLNEKQLEERKNDKSHFEDFSKASRITDTDKEGE